MLEWILWFPGPEFKWPLAQKQPKGNAMKTENRDHSSWGRNLTRLWLPGATTKSADVWSWAYNDKWSPTRTAAQMSEQWMPLTHCALLNPLAPLLGCTCQPERSTCLHASCLCCACTQGHHIERWFCEKVKQELVNLLSSILIATWHMYDSILVTACTCPSPYFLKQATSPSTIPPPPPTINQSNQYLHDPQCLANNKKQHTHTLIFKLPHSPHWHCCCSTEFKSACNLEHTFQLNVVDKIMRKVNTRGYWVLCT